MTELWYETTKWLSAAFFTILDNRKSLWSHFSPFHINTQHFLLIICLQIGHFGWPKITFDRISRHFRSIRNYFWGGGGGFISQNGHRRPLDDRKSLSIAFSPFQINTQLFYFLNFFHKIAENSLQSHFSPFEINTQLKIFTFNFNNFLGICFIKWPKITFDHIFRHLRSMPSFFLNSRQWPVWIHVNWGK